MSAVPLRRIGKSLVDRQRRLRHVVAQNVLQLDRLGRRRDGFRVQGHEDRVLIEDVVQLTLQARQLILGQSEAGEVGDVLPRGAGQAGHARDDTGRGAYAATGVYRRVPASVTAWASGCRSVQASGCRSVRASGGRSGRASGWWSVRASAPGAEQGSGLA